MSDLIIAAILGAVVGAAIVGQAFYSYRMNMLELLVRIATNQEQGTPTSRKDSE